MSCFEHFPSLILDNASESVLLAEAGLSRLS
jgi:hypothetical protein